jgi:hypothetical protein
MQQMKFLRMLDGGWPASGFFFLPYSVIHVIVGLSPPIKDLHSANRPSRLDVHVFPECRLWPSNMAGRG